MLDVNFSLTIAAFMALSNGKVTLVFVRRWGVPARYGDIPNAYVKADKEQYLEIYLAIPQGMEINESVLRKLGASKKNILALSLKKSLYGLRQAGRLWSKLLHSKLVEAGFTRSVTDMCLYYKREGEEMTIVGVYVDDLLVTASKVELVNAFFRSMNVLFVKDLGKVRRFFDMRGELDKDKGYSQDQQATIEELSSSRG